MSEIIFLQAMIIDCWLRGRWRKVESLQRFPQSFSYSTRHSIWVEDESSVMSNWFYVNKQRTRSMKILQEHEVTLFLNHPQRINQEKDPKLVKYVTAKMTLELKSLWRENRKTFSLPLTAPLTEMLHIPKRFIEEFNKMNNLLASVSK